MSDTKAQPPQDDLNQRPQGTSFENAPKLELGQTESTEEELTVNDFLNRQKRIFKTIESTVNQGGTRKEGYKKAREDASKFEEHQLRDFSEILLDAPIFYDTQKEKNRLEIDKKKNREAIREKAEELSEYNHRIRDLVLDNPGKLSRKDLTNWLAKASGNNLIWAEEIMLGISAEIAIMDTCKPLDLIKALQPGTVEEDLRKIDFKIIAQDGRKIKVDAKAGGSQIERGIIPVEDKVDYIEIGVNNSDILDDFTLSEEANSLIQSELREYLLGLSKAA